MNFSILFNATRYILRGCVEMRDARFTTQQNITDESSHTKPLYALTLAINNQLLITNLLTH